VEKWTDNGGPDSGVESDEAEDLNEEEEEEDEDVNDEIELMDDDQVRNPDR
jgi:hypothetical protein